MNIHCIIPSSHLITDGQKISNNNVIDIHHQAINDANNTTTNNTKNCMKFYVLTGIP